MATNSIKIGGKSADIGVAACLELFIVDDAFPRVPLGRKFQLKGVHHFFSVKEEKRYKNDRYSGWEYEKRNLDIGEILLKRRKVKYALNWKYGLRFHQPFHMSDREKVAFYLLSED